MRRSLYTSRPASGFAARLGTAVLIALLALAACEPPTVPQTPGVDTQRIRAIRNGHDLTSAREERSGLVRIYVWESGDYLGSCTASILKSSQVTNDAWLLTAAHCFYEVDDWDYGVHDVGSNYSVQVAYGVNLASAAAASASVFIHPDWDAHVDGGWGIWYDYPDVAVIHFREYIPVKNEDGLDYVEFTRPFFSGVMKDIAGKDAGVFGAKNELRWARGKFEMSTNGYLVIDGSDWRTPDAEIEHGDSGGPWLYTDGGESSSDDYIANGVIIGVTSGGHFDISPTSWLPADFFAAYLSRPYVTDFIVGVTNGAVPRVERASWTRQPTVQYSASGTGAWSRLPRTSRNTGEVAVADFGPHSCDAGTPRDDLFLTENGRWWISWCGTEDWTDVKESSTEIDDKYGLGFGDFNGDGATDVFRASGGTWKVSWSGNSAWTTINSSSTELTDSHGLGFGDFNGDGVTDVFRASGGTWRVSFSGTGSWTTIKSSSTEMKDEYGLALGDFNGDGIADVFRGSGGEWKVSYSGTSAWTTIKTSSTELQDEHGLLLGYFDGDDKVDVMRGNGTDWNVSYGGTSAWTLLKVSSRETRRLAAGQLAGDGRSDLLLVRNPIHCDFGFMEFCEQYYHLNNTAPRRPR